MIWAETHHKIHNRELVAIIKGFKSGTDYIKGSKHKVLVLTDYNNLYEFMNAKSLGFLQIHWAQELLRYNFSIDYFQGEANGGADALSSFTQRDDKVKASFWAENTRIFHPL